MTIIGHSRSTPVVLIEMSCTIYCYSDLFNSIFQEIG